MRSLEGLANEYRHTGRLEEAIAIYENMLLLNPNDNQGIRYSLVSNLIATKKITEAQHLLKQYDELSAFWIYSHVLLAYITNDKKKASVAKQALKINSFIPKLLKYYADNIQSILHLDPIESEFYTIGSKEEAEIYSKENFTVWYTNSGAIEWLVGMR